MTEADQKANSIIVEGLASHFPHDGIIAEESPLPFEALENDPVWYVDPLDGTMEFISHNGEFSVMIGMTVHSRSQLGVVYWPTKNQLFVGIADQEAWIEHEGTRHPLQATQAKFALKLALVASRSHRSPHLSATKDTLNIQEEHPMGSVGLKIGFIAQGRSTHGTGTIYQGLWMLVPPRLSYEGREVALQIVMETPSNMAPPNF